MISVSTNKEELLASKAMLPLILMMAMPGVAAQLINLLYSIVDRIFIGHIPDIGTDALAGVGITSSVIILITAFSSVVGIGGAPLASIALGKGNREEAKYILGNGVTLLLLFALLSAGVTYAFMEPILLTTGASLATLGYASDYLTIYLYGTLFVLISVGLNTFITLQGRPGIAMMTVVVGALINIVLDYLFIFIFDMGVAGAAYATVISQGATALWTFGFLVSKSATLKIQSKYLRPQRKTMLMMLALGLSPFVMSSTEALIGFVLNGSLKAYGDIHISSMAVMQSAILFTAIPLTGFSQGFMPIVSYNYGRGNSLRVRECFKIVLLMMGIFNLVLTLVMMIFPSLVAGIFTSDPILVDKVCEVMPIFLLGMNIFGVQRACQTMFISLGEARISIFIAVLRKIILLIPLAFILPSFMGVMGIYWAEAISDLLAGILCIIIFAMTFPKILSRKC